MTVLPIVLPAATYDALEASANRVGGVGGAYLYDVDLTPLCLLGHISRIDGNGPHYVTVLRGSTWTALADAAVAARRTKWTRGPVSGADIFIPGLSELNDEWVRAINKRTAGGAWHERVPWADFIAEAGIVRGEP